jgi:hypothetical protein
MLWHDFAVRTTGFTAPLLVAFSVVVLGYSPGAMAATPAASGVRVPVIPCAFSASELATLRQERIGLPGQIPAEVGVDVRLPAGSAIYGVSFPAAGPVDYVVGPAGYSCAPLFASADGGSEVSVEQGLRTGRGVNAVFNAGGIGPATDLACPYIPAVLAADESFRAGFPTSCVRPGGELVVQIPTGSADRFIAAVEVPAMVSDPNPPLSGSGKGSPTFALFTAQVFGGQSAGGQSAVGQAISCTLPVVERAICIAALQMFLSSQSNVGRAMSQASLSQAAQEIADFVDPSRTSPVATTLPTPHQAFSSVVHTVENVVITSVAIVFITFPAQMFNATLDENYMEIVAIWRRLLWRMGGRRRLAKKRRAQWAARNAPEPDDKSPRRELVTFLSVLAIGSLIGGFRDPSFGFTLASVANFVGTFMALAVLIAAPWIVATAYRKTKRRRTDAKLRAIPAGIVIAVVSVLISRLAHFQPGYLYGVVCGVAFAHKLAKKEEGHVVSLESGATLLVAVAAWIAFVPIDAAALHPGSSFWVALADDWLASIFVGGLVGVTIGLLPLRFLPGGTLFKWNRVAWAALFGVASFGVVGIMLRPSSGPARPGSAPVVTAVVLFVLFGGVSVAFRQYFASRHPAGDGESRVTAPTGVGRLR